MTVDNLLLVRIELTSGETLCFKMGQELAVSVQQCWLNWRVAANPRASPAVWSDGKDEPPWCIFLNEVTAIHSKKYEGEFERQNEVNELQLEVLRHQARQCREESKYQSDEDDDS